MERPFVSENEKARMKLVSLENKVTDVDLGKDAGEGWTVGVVFAHMAFWDQRTIVLLRRWKKSGVATSPVDIEVLNESLTPFLKAIPSHIAVSMFLETAETLCREIENLNDELVTAIEALGDKMRLHRYIHYQMHIDQIEKIIQS